MFKYFLVISTAFLFISNAYSKQYNIVIATGIQGGVYSSLGDSICEEINKDVMFSCRTVLTNGSIDSLTRLSQRAVDIIIAQTDIVNQAYNAESQFYSKPKFSSLRKMLLLYPETLNIVVKRNSTITSINDLKGKNVDVIGTQTGAMFMAKAYTNLIRWTTKDITKFKYSADSDTSYNKLCKGTVSAVLSITGHRSNNIQRAFKKCDLRFISVSTAPFGLVLKRNPFYFSASIPAYLYTEHQQIVPTLGVYSALLTTTALPNQAVYHFLDVFFKSLNRLENKHKELHLNIIYDVDRLDKDNVPYHQGALNYFRDNKWDVK